MRDFTIKRYLQLINTLQKQNYNFQTFHDFIHQPSNKVIILRHDVDAKNLNSLRFAKIQHQLGLKGTYYFRMVPRSFDEVIIKEIALMGHEIGYHYETMDTCRGNIDKAWDEFRRNLDIFRAMVPITTICMHGSPRSRFDNKSIWKKYDYRAAGIVGEPYFDIDFNIVAYFTDTGRRWNGSVFSLRDKVESPFTFNFRTTKEIIEKIELLPKKIMFTFHPQRWTDNPLEWSQEYFIQNIKNQVKRFYTRH